MTEAGRDESVDGTTVAWRQLLGEAVGALERAAIDVAAPDQEARWLVEEASGLEGAALQLGLDDPATVGGVRRLDALVARRLTGEPVQYVLGHWAFRHLDLLVDPRVLIPRPETEQVVEVALAEVDRRSAVAGPGATVTVVDLGTGTGAIALSIASERPATRVWATDVDDGALEVARANLAGLGRAATRVTLAEGAWFAALPDDLAGSVDVLVSNPPYVPDQAPLPAEVARWEPSRALLAGPDGLDDLEHLVDGAARWLAPGGAAVLELGSEQATSLAGRAERAGLVDVRVEADLTGRARALVARRPAPPA